MDRKKTEDLLIDINTLIKKDSDIDANYKKALRHLRKKLPVGWAKTISEDTGKSAVMVYKVINGENRDKDDAIVLRAIELAKEYASEISKRIKTIKEL